MCLCSTPAYTQPIAYQVTLGMGVSEFVSSCRGVERSAWGDSESLHSAEEQLWARNCESACWWGIRYSYSTSHKARVGVSLVILRALQRHSLSCVHIAECLTLLIYGCVINKIISSVTKYFKSPSLPPSLSSLSVRSAVKQQRK